MRTSTLINIALLYLITTGVHAQYFPFQKDSIRFEYNSRSNGKYGIKFQYNDDLEKDGEYLIYDFKNSDTVIVGRMHYRNDILTDSAVINTPDYKFSCFFVLPNSSYTRILIPALGEKAVPHGQYELSEYSNGTLFLYENYSYQYGRKNGLCKTFRLNSWDDAGEGEWEIYYMSEDVFNGSYLKYYEQGDTLESGVYDHGRKDGAWYTYHLYDKSKEITSYKNGLLDGVSKTWNKEGRLVIQIYYKNDKKDGLTRRWYDNGQRSSETLYAMDVPQHYTMWHDNGQVYVTERYDSVGRLEGIRECYYENGKKECAVHYVQGDKEGLAEYWNEKGIIVERSNYHRDVLDGKVEFFYDSGQRQTLSFYSQGKLNGVYKSWDERGKLVSHLEFKNDKIIKTYLKDNRQIVLESGDNMGEGYLIDDAYIRTDFKSKCTNVEYNFSAQRCVMECSLLLADMLNSYYEKLSKKQQKKWQQVKQMAVYCEIRDNKMTIISVSGGDAEWNAALLTFCRQFFNKPCGVLAPCSIKITLTPVFPKKK